MPDPEIARRCSACGAAIRQRAQFCPQCGEALLVRSDPAIDSRETANEEPEAKPTDGDPPEPTHALDTPDLSQTIPLRAELLPTERLDGQLPEEADNSKTLPLRSDAIPIELTDRTVADQPVPDYLKTLPIDAVLPSDLADLSQTMPLSASVLPTEPLRSNEPPPVLAATNVQNQRIPVQRAESLAERVGKIKKVSSVVLDQAAYDPSLRFVLVAGALFILFLFLLILSKLLG